MIKNLSPLHFKFITSKIVFKKVEGMIELFFDRLRLYTYLKYLFGLASQTHVHQALVIVP